MRSLHGVCTSTILIGAVCGSHALAAREPVEPSLALSGDLSFQSIVDLAAERLGLNIEYDKSTLRGEVTFRLGTPIGDSELWNLTNRLLSSKGYTTVRRPGEQTLGVIPLAEASAVASVEELDTESRSPSESTYRPGFRVVVLRLNHARPDDALTLLGSFRSGSAGRVEQVGTSNLIRIADLTPRVDQMLDAARRLDRPGSAVTVERVTLASAPAAAVLPRLTQLAAKRELAGAGRLRGEVLVGSSNDELIIIAPVDAMIAWRSLIETVDHAESSEIRTYRPRYFALSEVRALIEELLAADESVPDSVPSLRVVENDLTGSLVITATPSQHARIEDVLAELSEAPVESRQPLRSFVINNRDATEIRDLIEQLLSEGLIDAAARSSPETGAPALPIGLGTGSSAADRTRDIRLTVDEGTNTLLAAGEPRLLEQVASLISELDVRRPQVMIEVLLVTLTEGETLDLGVELQSLVSDSGTLVGLGSLFGLSDLSPFPDTSDLGTITGLGGTAVVLNPGEFSAVVRALETVNEGRSLSMPKVLVNDNETASIDAVQQEPFLSTNASDTVATTSFGGFESAGTTVSVTPQIAEGDHLALQYNITLSSFTGESPDPSTPPPRQQNSIDSVATIPDGFTIAVGGIEIRTEGEAESRVPGIGSIPLVGELFKNRSRSGSTSKFYAFIRADVMRHKSFEDLKHVSDPLREQVGIADDEPVLLPRVIR